MKLNLPCGHCHKQGMHNISTALDINDDGVYKVTCPNGHASIDFIKNEKYELIFDLGLLAVHKGFSREAVSNFAVSLERFYEYCIRVMLISQKVDKKDVDKTWKLVSNQSERQIGAYYFLYLSTLKERPEQFPSKQTSFRNSVIHKGYIPREEEVLRYAKEIYCYIIKYTIKLKEQLQHSMDELYFQKKQYVNNQYTENVSTVSLGTTLRHDTSIEALEKQQFDFNLAIHYINGVHPFYVK